MSKYIGKKLIKAIVLIFCAITVAYFLLSFSPDPSKCILGKPVIMLYPEETTEVSVRLDIEGQLTCTYPGYGSGWDVTAHPDGHIECNGRQYEYLFWEGADECEFDFSKGFCVKESETAVFLEEKLAEIGLNSREINDFIVYWLPQMQDNDYNLISFQQDVYTERNRLEITPAPDSLLRVFMAWKPVGEPVEIEPQSFPAFERVGFTAVEWGGSQVD